MFDNSLSYAEGVYRTPFLYTPFRHNELILKEKRLLIIEQPVRKIDDLHKVPQTGIEPVLAFRQTGF